MAFGINDEEVVAPTTGFGANDTVVPESVKPTPQQIERMASSEDLTKPAFIPPKQRITALPKPEPEVKQETIPFADLYQNKDNLKKIEDYATARFGKTGQREKGETDEQYVNRFARHMRFIQNNIQNYAPEQEWLNRAKPEDVLKAGEAYKLFENAEGFLSKGGQNPLRAIGDYAASIVSDPTTLAGLGVGKLFTGAAAKKAMTEGLKRTVLSKTGAKAIGAPMVVEAATGTTSDAYSQQRELAVKGAQAKKAREMLPQLSEEQQQEFLPQIEALEKEVEEGVDVGKAVLTGVITAPLSAAIETAPLVAASRASTKMLKTGDLNLNDIVEARKKQLKIADKPTELTGNKDADNVAVSTTNIYDGGDLLDEQGAPTAIAQMQVKNSLDRQADEIAASIWKQMPEAAPKPGEKTFEAVQRTLDSFDKLPEPVITQALADAGTDLPNFLARLEAGGLDTDALQKFSAMYGVSTSDAARTLQSKSVISRMLNKLREIDPESAKAVDALLGKKDPTTGALGTLKGYIDQIDRNMITAMTTNMATVMRNAFGVGVNSTYGAVEDGLESLLFNTGRKIAGHMRGQPVTGDIGRGINGAIDDTVNTWFYLGQQGLAKDITEEALKNNPMLMSKLLATAEEMQQSDLIKPVRILNTPAVLMDNYIRRAVFASSIDYHMKQVGLNMLDTIAEGKNIPIDVLRKGVDDALEFTFSKTPTEGLGLAFVKGVEAARPISTVVFPFARFLANATKWTWKHYNPGITAGMGAADLVKGVNMLRQGDEAGQALLLQGSQRIAQQATGLATLLAAYKYREENQDVPWNVMKSDDGTTVDLKYLFPMNVPFALADFYYKTANGNPEDFKTMDLVEALTGFKAVGTQGQMLDTAREAAASIAAGFGDVDSDEAALNKMNRSFGEFAGAWLGRATVPLNQFSDIISAFDADEALPRDIFIAKPGEKLSGLDIMGRQIQKGIPFAKQELPPSQAATREETAPRAGGPLKQLTGLALIQPKNEIEAEIERLNIPYQSVFRTTGDKTVDAEARKFMAQNIDKYVKPVMDSEVYKNATPEAQFAELKDRLSKLQTTAKNIATMKSIQDFYDRGEVPPIEQKKFEALPPKVRQATMDLYRKQTGKSLNEDTDFKRYGIALQLAKTVQRVPLAVQKEEPGFAVGGMVGKELLKKAGKKAATSATDLLAEMEAAATKAAPTPAPSGAIGQMADILSGTPAPAPVTPVKKPSKKAAAKPLEAQTQEAIPTTTPKEEIVPETPVIVEASPVAPTFTAEDYKLGEALMLESGYTPDMMQKMKKADYNSYMNEVHLFTGTAKGIKYKDIPPSPFLKKNEVTDEIEYDIEGNEISVNGVPVQPSTGASEMIDDAFEDVFVPEVDTTKLVKGAQAGDVEQSVDWIDPEDSTLSAQRKYVNQRNKVLSDIKNIRKSEFSKMRKDPSFDSYDDEVLAVLQGDFRKKFDREFDVATDKEAGIVMATRYQKKLDELREMYKDVPPKKLWHGNVSEKIEPVKKKGFADPQTRKNFHEELYVGAPSFTSDLNLNMTAEAFGGMNPSNILYTEIPYAEYVFTRINMKPEAYDVKDLSTIAQAINGSPNVARAVSLPRAGYFEKESMMPEANKLRLRSAAKDVEAAIGAGGVNPDLAKETAKTLDRVVKSAIKNNSVTDAYTAYGGIRDLMKQIESMSGNVSVKGGRGHQVAATLNNIAGDADKMKQYIKIADILDQNGAKQKAETLREFIKSLNSYGSSYGGRAAEEVERIPKLKSVFDSANKLAKGGFVSKRR